MLRENYMELSLNRDNKLEVSTELRNASTTVNESLDNAINTGLMKMDLKDNMITKIKNGFSNEKTKSLISDTINTALKAVLKNTIGMKARTFDNFRNLGKAIRDSNLKSGLKSVLNIGVDSIKGIPTGVKSIVREGIDLILGDTFDDELQKVMTKNKNTLSRINKKCDEFEKAFSNNNEKDMKKYVNAISKDLDKISLISNTIDRGKEIVNRYELMKNKGSTELSSIERELCATLA